MKLQTHAPPSATTQRSISGVGLGVSQGLGPQVRVLVGDSSQGAHIFPSNGHGCSRAQMKSHSPSTETQESLVVPPNSAANWAPNSHISGPSNEGMKPF